MERKFLLPGDCSLENIVARRVADPERRHLLRAAVRALDRYEQARAGFVEAWQALRAGCSRARE
jgi:hypothetical protein